VGVSVEHRSATCLLAARSLLMQRFAPAPAAGARHAVICRQSDCSSSSSDEQAGSAYASLCGLRCVVKSVTLWDAEVCLADGREQTLPLELLAPAPAPPIHANND